MLEKAAANAIEQKVREMRELCLVGQPWVALTHTAEDDLQWVRPKGPSRHRCVLQAHM